MRRSKEWTYFKVMMALLLASCGAFLVAWHFQPQPSMIGLSLEVVDDKGNVLGKIPLRQSNPLSILFFWEGGQADITQYVGLSRYIRVTPTITVQASGYDPNSPPLCIVRWTWNSVTLNGTSVPVKSAQLMSADYPMGTQYTMWTPLNRQYALDAEGFVLFIPIDPLVSRIASGQSGELRLTCTATVELHDYNDYSTILASKTESGTFACLLRNTG